MRKFTEKEVPYVMIKKYGENYYEPFVFDTVETASTFIEHEDKLSSVKELIIKTANDKNKGIVSSTILSQVFCLF